MQSAVQYLVQSIIALIACGSFFIIEVVAMHISTVDILETFWVYYIKLNPSIHHPTRICLFVARDAGEAFC